MAQGLKAKFITFEGSEGSGKSTQIRKISQLLKKHHIPFIFLREPGGTFISEKIRNILLDVKNKKMVPNCEMLLYMAARAQLVGEKIVPALREGKVVLCDRFLDSTIVYQGYGCGLSIPLIKLVGQFATQNIKPDLTLVFDIDTRHGLGRIKRKKDRIEKRALAYHHRVRKGYLTLAKKEPRRIKIIKVNGTIEEVHAVVWRHIGRLLRIHDDCC